MKAHGSHALFVVCTLAHRLCQPGLFTKTSIFSTTRTPCTLHHEPILHSWFTANASGPGSRRRVWTRGGIGRGGSLRGDTIR